MKLLDYKYAFEFIVIPRRQQLDANSALTAIQHALTFDYSGVSLTKATTTVQQGVPYLTPPVVHHGSVKANNNSLGNLPLARELLARSHFT